MRLLLLLLLPVLLFSESPKVVEKEIKDSQAVKFKNRSNTRANQKLKQENLKIGENLSRIVTTDSSGKYKNFYIQRFVSKDEGKLGADLISITGSNKYGHVNSLIRVLAGYISLTYKYNLKDSGTIAKFILYYNAIHRNDVDYFKEKYTSNLNENLIKGKAGIDKSYKKWAGNSQIVIPIETSFLEDGIKDITLEELENAIDKEVDKNKDATLKKKELDEILKKRIENERNELQLKKKEIRDQKSDLEKAKEKQKGKDPLNKSLQELDKAIKELEKEQDKIENREKELNKKQSKVDPDSYLKKLEGESNTLSKSIDNTKKENDRLVRETASIKNETSKLKKQNETLQSEIDKHNLSRSKNFTNDVIGGKIIFLKVKKYIANGRFNNSIYLLDPEKDDVLTEGKFHNITSKDYKEFGQNIVLVGFQENHINTNRLILLDKSNLNYVNISDVNVFWNTPIEIDKDSLFAIEEENNKFYLAKFNQKIQKIARSKEEISPFSTITIFKDKVYLTTGESYGKIPGIIILEKENLKLVKVMEDKKK